MSLATRSWLLVGLVLLTANLRTAITSLSPVLDEVRAATGLGGVAVSVLSTLPVLCLGVFASLAPVLACRLGTEATVTAALGVITAGLLLRVVPGTAALFGGTVLAGAGLAVGNVLVPAFVKEHFAERVGLVTGLAMTVMAASGALAAGVAVPLADAAGWRVALAVWAVPSLAATLLWGPLALRGRRRRAPGARPAAPAQVSLRRSRRAWSVAGFLGVVSLLFYVLTAWLPEIMRAHGYSAAEAGTMVSVMMTTGIPLGFVVPVLAARLRDQRPLVVAVTAAMAVGLGGILLAPQAGWLWVAVLGLSTGSSFPLAVTLLSLRSPDPSVAARLSGLAQTTGYLLAGVGPLTVGLVHTATGGWTAALLLLLALVVPETVSGLLAARPGFVHPGVAVGGPARRATPVR
ncbi:CynX/NimT family MFS transporter [Kitasatospora sp. McL0602]|uniref:CynX/NimT family MFS transporter n=1 Tax=Kitasatospora sp. McL0602 TaxID=3439530 RepID=UPI003F8CAE30